MHFYKHIPVPVQRRAVGAASPTIYRSQGGLNVSSDINWGWERASCTSQARIKQWDHMWYKYLFASRSAPAPAAEGNAHQWNSELPQSAGTTAKCWKWPNTRTDSSLERMNVPLLLLLLFQLPRSAVLTGSERAYLEHQLVEEGRVSGRRTGRLYCRVGIGFHLQIHLDGRVNGSHEPNPLSMLSFTISLWTYKHLVMWRVRVWRN